MACPVCGDAILTLEEGGSCPDSDACQVRATVRDARRRGFKPSDDPEMPEEEVLSAIRESGFAQLLDTRYRKGAKYKGVSEREWWYPIWAILGAKEALDNGDDMEEAIRAYYLAVRDIPEEDRAAGMLNDSRILE